MNLDICENPRATIGFIIAPCTPALLFTFFVFWDSWFHKMQVEPSSDLLSTFWMGVMVGVFLEIIVAIPMLHFFRFLKCPAIACCILAGIVASFSPLICLYIFVYGITASISPLVICFTLFKDAFFDESLIGIGIPLLMGALSGLAFWLAGFYKPNKLEMRVAV